MNPYPYYNPYPGGMPYPPYNNYFEQQMRGFPMFCGSYQPSINIDLFSQRWEFWSVYFQYSKLSVTIMIDSLSFEMGCLRKKESPLFWIYFRQRKVFRFTILRTFLQYLRKVVRFTSNRHRVFKFQVLKMCFSPWTTFLFKAKSWRYLSFLLTSFIWTLEILMRKEVRYIYQVFLLNKIVLLQKRITHFSIQGILKPIWL